MIFKKTQRNRNILKHREFSLIRSLSVKLYTPLYISAAWRSAYIVTIHPWTGAVLDIRSLSSIPTCRILYVRVKVTLHPPYPIPESSQSNQKNPDAKIEQTGIF